MASCIKVVVLLRFYLNYHYCALLLVEWCVTIYHAFYCTSEICTWLLAKPFRMNPGLTTRMHEFRVKDDRIVGSFSPPPYPTTNLQAEWGVRNREWNGKRVFDWRFKGYCFAYHGFALFPPISLFLHFSKKIFAFLSHEFFSFACRGAFGQT